MTTKLKIDWVNGTLEVEGEESFVKTIYEEYKTRLLQHAKPNETKRVDRDKQPETNNNARDVAASSFSEYASLGDVFADIENPNDLSDDQRALLAAAHIQAKGATQSFVSQAVNKELTHAGYKSDNITRDLKANMTSKPATIVQLRKSGSSQQARKDYKVTTEGFKSVERMLAGTNNEDNK